MTMPHPDLVAVLAGLLCVLVVASAIGYVLERRLSPDGSHAVIENLNHRIRAWWVMIVLMGLALIGGKAGVTLLFAFCSFAAFREFITLTTTHRADHWALAVPIARTHSTIAALFVTQNAYPREALTEAILRFIEEDLATSGK